MTPQEQDMINGLIDRVTKTQLPEKDTDAERLLQNGLARNPDSLYILAQTVLVQQYALDQAQAQLKDARSQVEQLQQAQQHPKPATSFLGSIFGSSSDDKPAPPPRQNYGQQLAPSGNQYAPVPGYAPQPGSQPGSQPGYPPQPGYGSPQYSAPMGGGSAFGGGGFLRGAAQTAAGVAAGALAFEGIESLMHGFGDRATGGFGGGGRPEEIVNNYYGDSGDRDRDSGDRSNFTGSSDDNPNDRNPGDNIFTDGGGDRNNFAGTDSSDDGNDSSYADGDNADDSSLDDNFTDDSGSDDTSSDDNSF